MVTPRELLLPPHRHLYRQVPHDPAPDDLTLAGIAGRVGLTLLILVGATLLGAVREGDWVRVIGLVSVAKTTRPAQE